MANPPPRRGQEPAPEPCALVYLVEDDDITARLVQRILDREGYAVERFACGEAMLERHAQRTPDVLVLDLHLPGYSGLEILEQMQPALGGMPVIMLTASTDVDDVVAAMQWGAFNYLTKPVESRKLLAIVDNAVQLGATRRELEQTQAMLIEAAKERAVSRLAAGVAHEIRNPLAIISQCLDFIRTAGPDDLDSTPMLVNMASDAVVRADKVARGLMEFAAAGEHAMAVGDVREIVANTAELAGHELRVSRLKVVTELGERCLPARFDRGQLQHALMNLIDNAIHATPAGGVVALRARAVSLDRRVNEWLWPGEQGVVIQVEDSGTGVDQEALERAFDPFFTTKPPGEGQGLGLAVARRIVELHRGDIQLDNTTHGGVIARIVLPMEGDTDERDEAQDSRR